MVANRFWSKLLSITNKVSFQWSWQPWSTVQRFGALITKHSRIYAFIILFWKPVQLLRILNKRSSWSSYTSRRNFHRTQCQTNYGRIESLRYLNCRVYCLLSSMQCNESEKYNQEDCQTRRINVSPIFWLNNKSLDNSFFQDPVGVCANAHLNYIRQYPLSLQSVTRNSML